MTAAESYQEELAALRGLLAQPMAGLHLLEFATMPQLEEILAEVRPLCGGRACLEIAYDPPRENPARLIERLRERIAKLPADPPPLVLLHPVALPDAAADGPVAMEFWKALNFRREALGALPAQILLCVDPWHHSHLVDRALDLLSWLMPRFHLIPPPDAAVPRTEMLTGNLSGARLVPTPQAAESRWETFWPMLETLRRSGPLPASSIRRYVLPLLESTLSAGNLVRARQVRDAVGTTPIPPEDLVVWHKLNALLACAAGDGSLAEDHAERLLALMETPAPSGRITMAAGAMHGIANALHSSGLFASAERFNRRLVKYFAALHGPEHPDTLSSRMGVAIALETQGDYAAAEQESRAVLAIQERVLGPEHPDMLKSRMVLAIALGSQGDYAAAEKEQRAILAIQNRVLGPEHPDTLKSRNNLATVLVGQGNHAAAEQESRAVLAIKERALGPEHPATLSGCFNLSLTLERQGRKAEALEFARRALAGRNKALGENHPDAQDANRWVEILEKK